MKKKVFALFACMIFTLALAAGCGNKTDTAPETPDTDNPTTGMPAPAVPPTEEELIDLYTYAEELYADISMANFEVIPGSSIVKDDDTYHKVRDKRFDNFDGFQKHLQLYFTDNCIKNEGLLDERLFTEGKDGYLYVLVAGRGANIFYAGYALGEPVVSEEEITFDVTAYYTTDEPYEGDLIENKFMDSDEFETEVYTFRLVPDGTSWKFDTFHIFY